MHLRRAIPFVILSALLLTIGGIAGATQLNPIDGQAPSPGFQFNSASSDCETVTINYNLPDSPRGFKNAGGDIFSIDYGFFIVDGSILVPVKQVAAPKADLGFGEKGWGTGPTGSNITLTIQLYNPVPDGTVLEVAGYGMTTGFTKAAGGLPFFPGGGFPITGPIYKSVTCNAEATAFFGDHRIPNTEPGVNIYAHGGIGIEVYDEDGLPTLNVPLTTIDTLHDRLPLAAAQLLAETADGYVQLWMLPDGEFQAMIGPDEDGKVMVIVFEFGGSLTPNVLARCEYDANVASSCTPIPVTLK
ncbi:MAG: hypothetical protein D6712_05495 [Chloroflexi bacterium]|nr:MAG: hypothetical protein D6712_05495 [Chloroflexota bacterium]